MPKERNPSHCIGCTTELNALDDDPNGEHRSTCVRCRAEEAHDFDKEPSARFARNGQRIADSVPEDFAAKGTCNLLHDSMGQPPVRVFDNGVRVNMRDDRDISNLTTADFKEILNRKDGEGWRRGNNGFHSWVEHKHIQWFVIGSVFEWAIATNGLSTIDDINRYAGESVNKVIGYLYGTQKLDSTCSDLQCTIAEEAVKIFKKGGLHG